MISDFTLTQSRFKYRGPSILRHFCVSTSGEVKKEKVLKCVCVWGEEEGGGVIDASSLSIMQTSNTTPSRSNQYPGQITTI